MHIIFISKIKIKCLISVRINNIIHTIILLDFSLTVKAATLIFISGRGSAIPSAK